VDELVEEDSQTPHVSLQVMAVGVGDFRGHVLEGPANAELFEGVGEDAGPTEVAEADFEFVV